MFFGEDIYSQIFTLVKTTTRTLEHHNNHRFFPRTQMSVSIVSCDEFLNTITSQRSSYKVAHPIAQCALRTHVLDAALLFTHPAQDYFSSDKHQRQHPQLLSPLSPVVESSSLIIPAPATKAKASSSSRRTRPSNAFMLFRSDYVRQNKHIGRRQQELSILAACAWRALGTDGQTGWYEKAAMARDQYDTTNKKESKPAARQRQRPYRPRGNGRDEDVVRAETGRSVRETYATVGPHSGLSRRRMRKNSDESLSPSTLSVQPTTTNTTVRSSTTIMASPSFIASPHHHHHRHHYHHRCTNRSEESTILASTFNSYLPFSF